MTRVGDGRYENTSLEMTYLQPMIFTYIRLYMLLCSVCCASCEQYNGSRLIPVLYRWTFRKKYSSRYRQNYRMSLKKENRERKDTLIFHNNVLFLNIMLLLRLNSYYAHDYTAVAIRMAVTWPIF